MTPLETIKNWLSTYPAYNILGELKVDYIDKAPCSSISPGGLVEIGRTEDIWGGVVVENQLNFALYAVLEKSPNDTEGAAYNADWLMDFQQWAQEQSIQGKAPRFGNTDEREVVTAQNGTIYEADSAGVGIYLVQLCVVYKQAYEE